MGTLTVYFVGICSHLREFTSRETEHRVVLINARDGRTINGETIVGHEASLRYYDAEGKPQKKTLDGVRITVPDTETNDVVYADSFFTCIPRLTTYAPKLPSLSLAVANGGDPNLVAAYFDAAGRFMAGVDGNEASVAVLNVVTTGKPRVRLQKFGLLEFEEITDLPEDASIQIENVGPGRTGGDQKHDFLLNFLVANHVSADAKWPLDPSCGTKVKLPFEDNTVDPGCSNSNYP